MSFTRNIYDSCVYKTFLSENKSAGNYMLYPGKYYNNNQCRIKQGFTHTHTHTLTHAHLVEPGCTDPNANPH